MKIRKDEIPTKTIEKIKNLLMKFEIYTRVTSKSNPYPYVFSCRIEVLGLDGSGVNGKGTSEDTAFASAYSELMERLQNFNLFDSLHSTFKGESEENYFDKVYNEIKKIEEYITFGNIKVPFQRRGKLSINENLIDFVDIKTRDRYYFDRNIIDHYIGSNGMCAGNSAEEALTQGFCEIMERYVLQKVYFGDKDELKIKLIPRNEYQNFDIYNVINRLEEDGFICKVLNCSLGGQYPVVGIVLLDSINLKVKFALGCDFDLEIAIQRCITELFQGKVSMFSLKSEMSNLLEMITNTSSYEEKLKNYFSSLRSWEGKIPEAFLTEDVSEDLKPFTNVKDNLETVKLCINLLGKEHEILIHDASFLGFPSYRILVTGMSPVKTNLEDYKTKLNAVKAIKNIEKQINIGKCDFVREHDILSLSKIKEVFRYDIKSIYDLLGITCYVNIKKFSLDEHLAQLYYINGKYELSKYYLKNKRRKIDHIRYYIIGLKKEGRENKEIDMLLKDFAESNYSTEKLIYDWLNDGKKIFPRCPDCCLCELTSYCSYDKFKKLSGLLYLTFLSWKNNNEERWRNERTNID